MYRPSWPEVPQAPPSWVLIRDATCQVARDRETWKNNFSRVVLLRHTDRTEVCIGFACILAFGSWSHLKRLNHQNVNFCVFHIFGVSPDLRMAKNTVNFPGGLVMERRWDTSVYRMLVFPCVWVLNPSEKIGPPKCQFLCLSYFRCLT